MAMNYQALLGNKKLGNKELGDENQQQNISDCLQALVKQWQIDYVIQQYILFIPWFALAMISGWLVKLTFGQSALLIFALVLGRGAIILLSASFGKITVCNFLQHLNHRFAPLQYSAQLLTQAPASLSVLENLQRDQVIACFKDIVFDASKSVQKQLTAQFNHQVLLKQSVAAITLMSVIFLTQKAYQQYQLLVNHQTSTIADPIVKPIAELIAEKTPAVITKQQVFITPPKYTQLPVQFSEQLDLSVIAASVVSWKFSFSNPDLHYRLVFATGESFPLALTPDGYYAHQHSLLASTVYHIEASGDALDEINLSDAFATIHTINVRADNAPKIRFITPKPTIVEFPKNRPPVLTLEAQVSDDFTLSKVEIMASIAKGSGESVKFRDQVFAFDRSEVIANKSHYFKTWDFISLGMEPGDELYFNIRAFDNRTPKPQQTQSSTKIIRWLEDEDSGVLTDGILIDFMPEYFKSQRQIIIETLELITDKEDLANSKFVELSELLGVAQSALKEKYGQYLGDEFEAQKTFFNEHAANENHDVASIPAVNVIDDHSGSVAVINTANTVEGTSRSHQHQEREQIQGDRSGRMASIERFGHNHEDSDVGVINKLGPKALMKRSLDNMWQAELHLMLAEPTLALPYEQQALKFLKMAKKADRIYVKRLGFEPPPVTEKRRYQGELDAIAPTKLTEQQFNEGVLSDQATLAFKNFYQSLKQLENQTVTGNNSAIPSPVITHQEFNQQILAQVLAVKQHALVLMKRRPALITILPVLERIILQKSLIFTDCEHCIELLKAKLWQLLPAAHASPTLRRSPYRDEDPIIQGYSQFLELSL